MIDAALIDAARILDGNPVPCFVIDEAHVVVYWNDALARVSGIPATDVLGTHGQWRAFYPCHRPVMADLVVDGAGPDVLTKFYRDNYRPLDFCPGGYAAEDFFPSMGEEGRWLAFSAAPVRNRENRVVGCVETLQDISERKRAETAMLAAERRLAEIIAGSPTPTLVVDGEGRATHWNRACEALTGVAAAQVLGTDELWRAFYPERPGRPLLAQMMVSEMPLAQIASYYLGQTRASPLLDGAVEVVDHFARLGADGTWLKVMAARLCDENGRVTGVIETLVTIDALAGDRTLR